MRFLTRAYKHGIEPKQNNRVSWTQNYCIPLYICYNIHFRCMLYNILTIILCDYAKLNNNLTVHYIDYYTEIAHK